jgi:hypothetical protein
MEKIPFSHDIYFKDFFYMETEVWRIVVKLKFLLKKQFLQQKT